MIFEPFSWVNRVLFSSLMSLKSGLSCRSWHLANPRATPMKLDLFVSYCSYIALDIIGSLVFLNPDNNRLN